MIKKRSIFTFGLCFVLFTSLFLSNIILAQDGGSYDPWMDLNDDGIVNAQDLQLLASIYSSSGTPINKTEKLLELEARLDSLNVTLHTEYYDMTVCDVTFVDASGDTVTGYLYVLGEMNVTGYLNAGLGTLYVDNVNGRVGIGTIIPQYELDVAGTLKTDMIVLGSGPGEKYIFFAQESSPFGEYIAWMAIPEEFVVTDDMDVQGTIKASGLDVYGDMTANNLDVTGDLKGETLKINQFQMGDAELNHDMYFYEDGNPLGEWISWQQIGDEFFVSDDTFIWGDLEITGTLNATGNIQGETLEVNSIQLGSTEGDSSIYFYEDGSPTGEYIRWDNSTDKFTISDDINIQGTITIPTTTGYYSIPPCAWQPAESTYDFHRWKHAFYTTTAGTTWWFVPLYLPHGAILTELEVWLWDNHASDIQVELVKGLATIASVSSSGSSEAYVAYTNSTISWPMVDNTAAYCLLGQLSAGDGSHAFSDVQITYIITEIPS